ncbi:MAG: hypothetical protein CVT66_10675 [Actinobacteria bacterium HGW-Actinobacteria-6]|jgi:hypothetical protein|nr:MAG: hypothetical protein CVT66_10675 [Actinobacteria bacterium HGW-Actinobacteria-6]
MSDDIDTSAEEVDFDRFEDLIGEDLVIARIEADDMSLSTCAVGMADVIDAHLTGSAAGAIVAENDISMSMSGAGAIAAQGDITMDRSGAGAILAGGNVSIVQGGAETILSGGSVSVESGGVGVVIAREVAIKDGWVGLACGGNVEIGNDVEVMFGPREAVFIGAAFGAVFALIFGLIVTGRRGYDDEE